MKIPKTVGISFLVITTLTLIVVFFGKNLTGFFRSDLISETASGNLLETNGVLRNLGEIANIITIKDGVVITDQNGDHIYYGTMSTTLKGRFFAFNLDKRTLLDEKEIEGAGVWSVKEYKGKIYFGTYYPATLYEYDPAVRILTPLTALSGSLEYIWDISFDETGIYMGTFDGEPVKYDFDTKVTTKLGNLSQAKYSRSIETLNGKVYIGFGGARKDGSASHAELVEYDPLTGTSINILPEEYQTNSIPNDMTIVDGKLLVFYDQWSIFQYNPATKEFNKLFWGGDPLVNPIFDVTHKVFTGLGGSLYMYNTSSTVPGYDGLGRISPYGNWARQSGAYMNADKNITLVTYDGDVVTEKPDGTIINTYSLANYGLKGAATVPFSMAADNNKIAIGATKIRILDTLTGKEKYQIPSGEPKVMTFLRGALVTANYTAGNIWKFPENVLTTTTNEVFSNSGAFLKYEVGENQIRPKGITSSGSKILIGTEPGYSLFGGALSFYDDFTKEHYTAKNIVDKHTIYSVAFDEKDTNIAYLGTSAIGGTGVNTEALLEPAHLVKWNIKEKKVVYDVIPKNPENGQYDRTMKRIISHENKLYIVTSFGDLLMLNSETGALLSRQASAGYVDVLLSREGKVYATKTNCFGELTLDNLNFTCIKGNIHPAENLLVQDKETGVVYFNNGTDLWSFNEAKFLYPTGNNNNEKVIQNITDTTFFSWFWMDVLDNKPLLDKKVLDPITPFMESIFSSYKNDLNLNISGSGSQIVTYKAENSDGKEAKFILNNSTQPYTLTLPGQTLNIQGVQISSHSSSGTFINELQKNNARNDFFSAMNGTGSGILWGVNGHSLTQEGYNQAGVPFVDQLDRIQEAGLTSYRQDVNGKVIPDILLTEAAKRNITILPVIFPPVNLNTATDLQKIEQDAYTYAYEIANTYKQSIPVWELQNELDNYTMIRKGETTTKGVVWTSDGAPDGNDTGHYEVNRTKKVIALLRGMNNGIHAADPTLKTTIDAGWLHYGYIQNLVNAGIDFDILSWHWYSNMGDITKVKGTINLVNRLGAFGKPIWITEGNRWGGDSDKNSDAQAQYARTIIAQMENLSPLIKAYYFYELLDEPYLGESNSESHFGLLTIEKDTITKKWKIKSPKPVFYAIKDILARRNANTALQFDNIPEIRRVVFVPNNKGTIKITVPAGSATLLSELPLNLQESALGIQENIKNILGSAYPKIAVNEVLTLQTADEIIEQNNTNVSEVRDTNMNKNIVVNQNQNVSNLNAQINTNTAVVNQNSVNSNVSTQNTPINGNSVSNGVGGGSIVPPQNQNQNLKNSAPVQTTITFKDIAGYFASSDIEYLAQKGILQGRRAGVFEPNGTLNRAEAMKAVIEALYPTSDAKGFINSFAQKNKQYSYVYFIDVPLKEWYAGYIGIAKESRIVNGTTLTTFEPGKSANRAEVLKFIFEAKKINVNVLARQFTAKNQGYFRDVPAGSWYAPYVYAAAEEGIIEKRSYFEPAKAMTRGEFAKVLAAVIRK